MMLNMDFFQPFKHVRQSYGVLYISLMNLPRSERFKQENILLVGVIPAFEHEPSSLNPFLQPLVDELQEFWASGVRLYTAESPKYKLLFRLALMCVACDIPAAKVIMLTWAVQDVLNIFLVALVVKILVDLIELHGHREI